MLAVKYAESRRVRNSPPILILRQKQAGLPPRAGEQIDLALVDFQ